MLAKADAHIGTCVDLTSQDFQCPFNHTERERERERDEANERSYIPSGPFSKQQK
jgi:hypothetical protein